MKDMLNTIYTEIRGDPAVSPYPIKYYDYPEAGDGETFVVIKPLAPPVAAFGASDKELAQQLTYQIDVQSGDRMLCKQIQQAIKKHMYSLGFSQLSEGLDEFFSDTKRYADARRYRTVTQLYDVDY
ncbi:hypothetical protein [Lacticaseibacillus paracasei]|uniref:hypothetical protein n=1 Tax=Lacticaseibacillus paracasei TaxID=1597 RepID=UPI0008DD87D9|nr:hypothetical protein [Lacticaseibacillus paracasei]OHY53221.1 hypothetical protein BBX46_07870 [Lacticaseibacillus paracasei]